MQSKPEASHEHRNRARISVSSPEGIESMFRQSLKGLA